MVGLRSILGRAQRFARFGFRSRAGVFEHIFESRYWGDRESVSGMGSSLAQTANIRQVLPELVKDYRIQSLIDAPCGDLYWMAPLLDDMAIDYLGGDIVPQVVEMARNRTDNPRAKFRRFDIVEDPFPAYDLWMCRDVLFHLTFGAIRKALDNFLRSEVKYLLVTSHTGPGIVNRNMTTGDFRYLDLLEAPFGFPADKVLFRFRDYAPPAPPRDMLLFAREDLVGRKLI